MSEDRDTLQREAEHARAYAIFGEALGAIRQGQGIG